MAHQKDLMWFLSDIPDPRVERGKRHHLQDILAITVCAYICGADSWVEVVEWAKSRQQWLEQFLALPHGIPSHDTFGRVFMILEPQHLETCLRRWFDEVRADLPTDGERQVIALDGKVLRGSRVAKTTTGVVSAWVSSLGMVLGVEGYTSTGDSEKNASERLLRSLHIKGCIVSLDAGGASQKICQSIVEQEADFVIGLKGNHGQLHQLVKEVFSGRFRKLNTDFFHLRREENSKPSHGRQEKRHYELINVEDIKLPELNCWREILENKPEIKSLARVKTWRDSHKEERYFMTSLTRADLKTFSKVCRSHWKIENQLHWTLDVAFREDHNRTRIKQGAENMAVIRRLALGILKQDKHTKIGIQAKRRKAGWDNNYLLQIIKMAEL